MKDLGQCRIIEVRDLRDGAVQYQIERLIKTIFGNQKWILLLREIDSEYDINWPYTFKSKEQAQQFIDNGLSHYKTEVVK